MTEVNFTLAERIAAATYFETSDAKHAAAVLQHHGREGRVDVPGEYVTFVLDVLGLSASKGGVREAEVLEESWYFSPEYAGPWEGRPPFWEELEGDLASYKTEHVADVRRILAKAAELRAMQ